MAHSSILGGQRPPEQASGKNTGALGPSDSSDSGSDVQGELPSTETGDAELRESAVTVDLDSDGDSAGTGDRGAAVPDGARDNADIETDSERDLFDDPLDAEAAEPMPMPMPPTLMLQRPRRASTAPRTPDEQ